MVVDRVSALLPQTNTLPLGRLVAAVGFVGLAFGAFGCQRALFPQDLPRTQFETYDKMRQRYVPLEEPDVFGTPQPALRARLSQQQE
ncbi:MAG: hypothetical protein RLY21_13 [Planctomycetota bacterium]|jgi:hypothetical protein